MLQTHIPIGAALPPSHPAKAAAPRPRQSFRARVMLQTGVVATIECINRGQRPRAVDADPLAAVQDAFACWPGTIGVSIPVENICVPTPAAGLRLLLGAVQAGEIEAGRLEVILPGRLADQACPDGLLALAELRDRDVGLVLDGTQAALPAPEALELLSLTGLMIDARVLSARQSDKARLMRLRGLLRACGEFGVTLMASGIETEVQRAILCGLGCVQGSGELFGLPIAGESRLAVAVH